MIKICCDICQREINNGLKPMNAELLPLSGYSDSNFAIMTKNGMVYMLICDECKSAIYEAIEKRRTRC